MTAGPATATDAPARGSVRIRLTPDEAAGVAALADGLSRIEPRAVDDPGWVAAARAASCELPLRLRQTVRAYRNDPGADGLLLVGGLPIAADALPPTPHVPESAEPDATLPAAVAMLIGLQLGEIVAYRDEKRGSLVQNVVPVRALETSQSNGGSVSLEFHTENAYHPHRPDYVGLLCLRPAREGVGTTVASVRRALPLLSDKDVAVLREPRFETAAPPSFRNADRSPSHPVLTGHPDDPDIRVDFHATRALDDEGATALHHLGAALESVHGDPELRPGEMVFLDNRLVVHGRGAFTPRYDGTDRWLHRVFVHLDNRRNRERRTGGGAVLT
ncbi:TauD/TfdA family dioxygenase [Actinacidiphila epipremni]|uniref:TauD/TfdA family dioxygenase n=1 Tax=Actinacidiphila epipremni TaxID=2053013 RepID=UPI002AFEB7B6|nr:TauD/TfdA family dioxygenase [Actinacidiphila epipremni]